MELISSTKGKICIAALVVLILSIVIVVTVYLNSSEDLIIKSDCSFDIIGSAALEFPPILTDETLDFVLPEGTEDDRNIPIEAGKVVVLACPGTEFEYESVWGEGPVYSRCIGGSDIDVWYPGAEDDVVGLQWKDMSCRSQPKDNVDELGECGPTGEGSLLRIGFQMTVDGDASTILVCHDLNASATLWAQHSLWDEISAQDHGNNRPSFKQDSFFDYDVNQAYTKVSQIAAVAELVGSRELAEQYIEESGSNQFMSRGHLAPNADFIFYSWMDATFHFINVAPQWQSFNGVNWVGLENGARDFVVDKAIDAIVYTGTHGVMKLADVNGNMVEIYLHNKNQLPVPRFFWKIIYDPIGNAGVAVVGVNNPHVQEINETYQLCPALDNPTILDRVSQPENIERGYIYACRVEDLSAAVPEVPELPAMQLLN